VEAMIDRQLDQIDLYQREDRQIALYNQARNLIDTGRADAARAPLLTILENPANPKLAEAARQLLATLTEPPAG
jgi:hypothetical protein